MKTKTYSQVCAVYSVQTDDGPLLINMEAGEQNENSLVWIFVKGMNSLQVISKSSIKTIKVSLYEGDSCISEKFTE